MSEQKTNQNGNEQKQDELPKKLSSYKEISDVLSKFVTKEVDTDILESLATQSEILKVNNLPKEKVKELIENKPQFKLELPTKS